MSRSWTFYWGQASWDPHVNAEGSPLDHVAGNQFRKRGVSRGDRVYVVSIRDGVLFLGARLTVDLIVSQAQASERLKSDNLWDASEHIIAVANSGTALQLRRSIPSDVAKQLAFECPGRGAKRLCFVTHDLLDRQAMRGLRELTPASATLLDGYIGQ